MPSHGTGRQLTRQGGDKRSKGITRVYAGKAGPFGVLTLLVHEWDEPVFCQHSMRLLANDVMADFARHAEQVAAA